MPRAQMQGNDCWILDAAGGMIATRDDGGFELSISPRGVIYRGATHHGIATINLGQEALAMPAFGCAVNFA